MTIFIVVALLSETVNRLLGSAGIPDGELQSHQCSKLISPPRFIAGGDGLKFPTIGNHIT